MDAEEKSDNGIKTLYKEATENHRYMVEWRHKIMVRYFLVVAAFFFMVKLMWETDNPKVRAFLFLVFLFLTLISFGFYLMDKRNTEIMYLNAHTAKRLEALLHENGGYYTDLLQTKVSCIHLSTIFRYGYLIAVITFALFSILSFIKYTI